MLIRYKMIRCKKNVNRHVYIDVLMEALGNKIVNNVT